MSIQTNSQPDTVIQVQEATGPVVQVYEIIHYNDYDASGCCSPYAVIFFFGSFFRLIGILCSIAFINTRNKKTAWKYALFGFVLSTITIIAFTVTLGPS